MPIIIPCKKFRVRQRTTKLLRVPGPLPFGQQKNRKSRLFKTVKQSNRIFMNQIKSDTDKNRALDILEQAFYDVPGVMWMIKHTKYRRKHLRLFLSLCFQETSEKHGAYLTSDGNGVVFFYNLQERPHLVLNFFRKIYIILAIIGVKRSLCVLNTRKLIDQVRPKKGWYGWFLATAQGVIGTRAGYEIKRDMFKIADETNEPIYVETTIRRIMILYTKIGFHEYAKRKHPYEDLDIWFMKRDPHPFT
jgi:hypothetical protein